MNPVHLHHFFSSENHSLLRFSAPLYLSHFLKKLKSPKSLINLRGRVLQRHNYCLHKNAKTKFFCEDLKKVETWGLCWRSEEKTNSFKKKARKDRKKEARIWRKKCEDLKKGNKSMIWGKKAKKAKIKLIKNKCCIQVRFCN